jgi:hypothetical protein
LEVCCSINYLLDGYKYILVGIQTIGQDLKSLSRKEKFTVRNYIEVVVALKTSVDVSLISHLYLDDLIPLYSKGGLNSGTLSQSFPLAASEQFILDPEKVFMQHLLFQETVLFYDPVCQKLGVTVSPRLHHRLTRDWKKYPSFQHVKELPRAVGKSFLLDRLRNVSLGLGVFHGNNGDEDNLEENELMERDEDGNDDEESACPLFQTYKSNFVELAMKLLPVIENRSRNTALILYEDILTSTRIVQVKKDRSYSHLSVEDVIELLMSEKDIKKESFCVAGSLQYDPDLQVLRIVSSDETYNVVIRSSSLTHKELERLAVLNAFDRSGHKRIWTCIYRIGINRGEGGIFRLRNVRLDYKEGIEYGPEQNPKENRYKVLDDGLSLDN